MAKLRAIVRDCRRLLVLTKLSPASPLLSPQAWMVGMSVVTFFGPMAATGGAMHEHQRASVLAAVKLLLDDAPVALLLSIMATRRAEASSQASSAAAKDLSRPT